MFCYCLLAAGQPCVLLVSVGGWTAMCFVAVCWALAGKLCVLLLSVGRWLPFQKHAGTTACGDRNPGEGENFLGAVQEESKKAPVILHPTAMLQEVLAKSKKGNGMMLLTLLTFELEVWGIRGVALGRRSFQFFPVKELRKSTLSKCSTIKSISFAKKSQNGAVIS